MSRPGQTSSGRGDKSSGSGFSLSSLASGLQKVGSYAQQAWDFAQAGIQGYQQAQQFAASLGIGRQPSGGAQASAPAPPPVPGAAPEPAPPAPAAFAPPPPAAFAPAYDAGTVPTPQVPAQPQVGVDQIAALLQALQQRQIPQLPGAAPSSPFAASAPAPAPAAPAAPQQPNALALLGTILTNPQLQQVLQSGPARNIQLPVPSAAAPGHARSVPIPLNAVLSAVLSLAGHSMSELAEAGEADSDDAPLYALGDDGYMLADPRDSDQRDALIAYLFRLNAAARDAGWYPQADGSDAGGISY